MFWCDARAIMMDCPTWLTLRVLETNQKYDVFPCLCVFWANIVFRLDLLGMNVIVPMGGTTEGKSAATSPAGRSRELLRLCLH